jgi:outer membrane protein assembly factor BamB
MDPETLQAHLRRATRNFTSRLPEDDVLTLGLQLLHELARAHAESPPRHPGVDPAGIPMVEGRPRLDGGAPTGDVAEDLFRLGALLHGLASGTPPDLSWRLDGPPPPEASTLLRRAALSALAAPRRDQRFPTARAAAAGVEAALAGTGLEPEPWPAFRGHAARSGTATGTASARGLSVAWSDPAGPVVSSPLLTRTLAVAATQDGRLVFRERGTGRTVHEERIAAAIESSPTLGGRTLHVGTDDGELLGVDVLNGRPVYRARLGSLVRSSPLALSDRVIVGVVLDKGAGALVAVDAVKGKVIWRRALEAVFSSPAAAGERVLVGCDDGSLKAVDAATGAVVWSHALGAKVRATPAIGEGLAVVGDFAGRLAAVRIDAGGRAWTSDVGHAFYSSACLAHGLAVVGCNEGHVHGFDLASGASRFEVKTGGPVVASPTAVADAFLVGSTDGEVYLIGAEGVVRARARLAEGGVLSSAAADGDLAVVGSAAGLHGLRLTP